MGKYTLTKYFWISCAHSVKGAGKCERIHGHNYKVTFCIEGNQLDQAHMLIDFREVKHALEDRYDHHFLNHFPEFNLEAGGANPSTEKIAEVFYHTIEKLCQQKQNAPRLKWVEIEETNEAKVRYEKC